MGQDGPLGSLAAVPAPHRAPRESPRAEMLGSAAADWLLIGPEETRSLDIRVCFRTYDSAVVYAHYTGGVDASGGLELPSTIYVAPRFEISDERYAWLNRVQAIGKGVVNEDLSLHYEWYEVRSSSVSAQRSELRERMLRPVASGHLSSHGSRVSSAMTSTTPPEREPRRPLFTPSRHRRLERGLCPGQRQRARGTELDAD